jgi:hypothetical protein
MEMDKTIETLEGIFTIKPYSPDDEKDTLKLWKIVFGDYMTPEIWRWKYHNNPFGRQFMICKNDNNEVVASYSGVPFPARNHNNEVLLTHIMDSMSHPDYRFVLSDKRGLFIHTAEHFYNQYNGANASLFYYGFPNKRVFRLGNIFLQYKNFTDGVVYLQDSTNSIYKKNIFSISKVKTANDNFQVFDSLDYSAKKFYPIAIKRSSEFIQWRFINHPVNKYMVLIFKNWFNVIKGYAVIFLRENKATIVDIFVMPDQKVVNGLLNEICSRLKQSDIETIDLWLPANHFVLDMMLKYGFKIYNEPSGMVPCCVNFSKELDIVKVSNEFFYTMGDGDLL